MRYPLLIFAIALVGDNQARADMVYYNMSGIANGASFQWIPSANGPPPPVSIGDHITWTLQYDRSLPGTSEAQYSTINYNTNALTITNIVDQTSGAHWFSTLSPVASTLSLFNDPPKKNSQLLVSTDGHSFSENYETALQLNYNGSFPTANLASLQLNSMPLNLSSSSLQYQWGDSIEGIFFNASVNSITPVQGAPEPGSLTLFLLGIAGLAARSIRRLCPLRYCG